MGKPKLKEHDMLKLLFVMGDDYATFAGDAAWEDTKFDLKHLRDFSRIAVVTDVNWVTKTMKIFAPVLPYELKVFPMAEIEEAVERVVAGDIPLMSFALSFVIGSTLGAAAGFWGGATASSRSWSMALGSPLVPRAYSAMSAQTTMACPPAPSRARWRMALFMP